MPMARNLIYRDDSPGIPLEFRQRVMGAMTTLKSRDEVEGSGMGLAHVRKIVATYGGTLRWLDMPGGRGVGFEMRFPR
jgi:signal transduction histidine kinase